MIVHAHVTLTMEVPDDTELAAFVHSVVQDLHGLIFGYEERGDPDVPTSFVENLVLDHWEPGS